MRILESSFDEAIMMLHQLESRMLQMCSDAFDL